MENKNAQMIRDYINLTESIDKNSSQEIDETSRSLFKFFSGDAKALQSQEPALHAAFTDVLKFARNDKNQLMGLTKKSPNKMVPLNDVDDLLYAIRTDRGMTDATLALFNQGLLKSAKTPAKLIDDIAKEVVGSKKFIDTYSKMTPKQMELALKNKQYSDPAIKSLMDQSKKNSAFAKARANAKSKNTTTTGTTKQQPNPTNPVPPQQTKTIKDRITELRDLIRNKKAKWSKVVKWGAGLGVSAVALWWFFSENSDETPPVDIPEKCPKDLSALKPCVKALVDSGAGEVFYSKDGTMRVWVRKTGNEEYDKLKGLVFFENGKVLSQDLSKKGSYTCKGSQAVINEQTLSGTEYDIIQSIDTATKGMGTNVGKLKSALEKIKDAKTYNTINKNMGEYTSYNSIQSMLQGEMGVANYGDMQQIRKTLAAAGVDVRFKSQTLLGGVIGVDSSSIKLAAISGGGDTDKTKLNNTTGDLSGIEITWDDDKKTPEPDPTPNPIKTDKIVWKECKDFPYVFGCKGERIGEIQRCLGISDDTKFGRNTLKAIEAFIMKNNATAGLTSTPPTTPNANAVKISKLRTEGITKELYDEILSKCKKENTATIKSGETKTDTATVKPEDKKVEPSSASTETTKDESPAELYARLVKNGNLRGRLKGRRIVYKGPDLTKQEQEKLTQYFNSQGYRLSRDNFDKSYGDKYVYKRNKPEETTGV